MTNAARFEGKVCLVTGAGSGIGRATLLRLAAEGGIVVAADLDAASARETIELAGLPPERALAIEVDVRSAEQTRGMAAEALGRYGQVDVLVNNAGIEILGDI